MITQNYFIEIDMYRCSDIFNTPQETMSQLRLEVVRTIIILVFYFPYYFIITAQGCRPLHRKAVATRANSHTATLDRKEPVVGVKGVSAVLVRG